MKNKKKCITSDHQKFIAERISKLRIAKNVSARDMSLSMGQNVNYINQIENMKSEPSIAGLVYVCEYFGITLSEFFYEGDHNPLHVREFVNIVKTFNAEFLIKLGETLKLMKK